jgi:hypothetical protein
LGSGWTAAPTTAATWAFVSGRALKSDGRIVGDQNQVLAEAQAASDRIQKLLGLAG